MISQAAEYALMAVIRLARSGEAPLPVQQIAADTAVPPSYLAKVMQLLVRGGIVTSQRGLNGGFVLTSPPAKLTLLDVVATVDPSRRIASCPMQRLHGHGKELCPLHRRLDTAAAHVEQILRDTTVADLLTDADHAHKGSITCRHGVHHHD